MWEIARKRRPMLRALLVGPIAVALMAIGVPATASAAPTGQLVGLVTADGGPLASALVTMTPVTGTGQPAGTPEVTFTDASGRYRFDDLPDQLVKLHVRGPLGSDLADLHWPAAYSFSRAATIRLLGSRVTADLDLTQGGSIEGRVVDSVTGAPVSGARVTAHLPGEASGPGVGRIAQPSRAGGFALSNLPPVPLQLRIELPPGSPHLVPAAESAARSGDLLIDGAAVTSGMAIKLRRGAEIRGTVTDDSGAPLAGARVRLLGCSPRCPPPTLTDASGAYRLGQVPPGSGWRVAAVPGQGLLGASFPGSGTPTPIGRQWVGAGDVVDGVDITLTRAAFLDVELSTDVADQPVRAVVQLIRGATIYNQYIALGVDGDDAGRTTGDLLRVRVGPVPPGEYSLRIRTGAPTIGQLPTRWVSTSAVEATPTIRLAAGDEAAVAVRISPATDPGGDPVVRDAGVATGAATGPEQPGTWPGLRQGFLAPHGAGTLPLG